MKNILLLFVWFWGRLTPRVKALLASILLVLLSITLFLYLSALPYNAKWLQSSAEIGLPFLWQQIWQKLWFAFPFGAAGIGIAGAISWLTWLMRVILSRFYKPTINDFRTTTSVVVPAYREDPEVIVRCLESWLANQPTEVIMVVDLADTEVLERLKAYAHDPRLRVIPFQHQGKRSALGVGIRAARGEVLVLADSDTAWEPGLLDAVQMPFVDPTVGGVGTRQNAVLRESSVWRIIADWLVNIRYLDYVPAESLFGGVACLSGRTAAYRLSVVKPMVEQLEYEYFMGRLCIAGDDGRLTWLVLSQGYKTVYQSSARAWSMFPNELQAFIKQRIRWSRNSCRCYLTAIYHGWLWQQPIVTQIRALQILLTPLTQCLALVYLLLLVFQQNWLLVAMGLGWLCVSRAVRSISHLCEQPRDIFFLPLVTLSVITIALPVKVWAFISMNKHGWLTRTTTSVGGEGQSEASLYQFPTMLEASERAIPLSIEQA